MNNLYTKIGLTESQAGVYEFLLEKGKHKASEIANKIKRPRGVVYKALEELESLGLVDKSKKSKIIHFSAEHPSKLKSLLEAKAANLKKTENELESSLPDLVSAFNLISNKPGVKYYEGDEGIEKALNDTLKSKTEIYTYADLEAVDENVKAINNAYSKKREKLGIKKKIIVADTDFNKKFLAYIDKRLTEIKYLPKEFYNFNVGMQIYDNKISYQTIDKENRLAILIEDENIYRVNKLLFEYIWKTLN